MDVDKQQLLVAHPVPWHRTQHPEMKQATLEVERHTRFVRRRTFSTHTGTVAREREKNTKVKGKHTHVMTSWGYGSLPCLLLPPVLFGVVARVQLRGDSGQRSDSGGPTKRNRGKSQGGRGHRDVTAPAPTPPCPGYEDGNNLVYPLLSMYAYVVAGCGFEFLWAAVKFAILWWKPDLQVLSLRHEGNNTRRTKNSQMFAFVVFS